MRAIEQDKFDGAPLLRGHVLIVEDQIINQKVLASHLSQLGITFETANNGREALAKCETKKFDLILMDLRMPVMSGKETTSNLRSQSNNLNQNTPVIALSAELSKEEHKKCQEAGMAEIIAKPVDFKTLARALSKWLSPIDGAAIEKLANYTSGDTSLTEALIADFETSYRTTTEQMRNAHATKNLKMFSDLAHGLKSAAATLGAVQVANLCQEIEDLKELPSAASAETYLNRLIDSSATAVLELKSLNARKVS